MWQVSPAFVNLARFLPFSLKFKVQIALSASWTLGKTSQYLAGQWSSSTLALTGTSVAYKHGRKNFKGKGFVKTRISQRKHKNSTLRMYSRLSLKLKSLSSETLPLLLLCIYTSRSIFTRFSATVVNLLKRIVRYEIGNLPHQVRTCLLHTHNPCMYISSIVTSCCYWRPYCVFLVFWIALYYYECVSVLCA